MLCTVHSFESVRSTQDIAKQYLAEGRPLPFAILAEEQTAGRGRGGNVWVSPPKGNLYCSLGIETKSIPLKDAGQYSFLTAVALMETFASLGIQEAQNKWPNDILVRGQKIAGILLESHGDTSGHLQSLIIGFGVNLQWAPDGAISVKNLIGKDITARDFLDMFLKYLEQEILAYAKDGFSSIRQKWLEKAYGLGDEIRVRLPKETFTAQFDGLDVDGALLVKRQGQTAPQKIYSGEVFFEKKEP